MRKKFATWSRNISRLCHARYALAMPNERGVKRAGHGLPKSNDAGVQAIRRAIRPDYAGQAFRPTIQAIADVLEVNFWEVVHPDEWLGRPEEGLPEVPRLSELNPVSQESLELMGIPSGLSPMMGLAPDLTVSVEELHYRAAHWDGTPETSYLLGGAPVAYLHQRIRAADEDSRPALVLIQAYLAIKMSGPTLTDYAVNHLRYLESLHDRKDSYGTASRYLTAKIHSLLVCHDPQKKARHLKRAHELFAGLRESVAVPDRRHAILLPGIRSESSNFFIYSEHAEPVALEVPAPHRYAATHALAVASHELTRTRPRRTAAQRYVTMAESSCDAAQSRVSGKKCPPLSEFAEFNLRLCVLTADLLRALLNRHGERQTLEVRRRLDLYLDDLRSPMARDIAPFKVVEWTANCVAMKTALSASRPRLTDTLHELTSELHALRKGKVEFLQLDPAYELAHHKDPDALSEFQQRIARKPS